MDLSDYLVNGNEDKYDGHAKRKCSVDFFSSLPDNLNITKDQLNTLIQFGEQVYLTTFTDDSDYLPGCMDFKPIRDFPSELKEYVLNYMHNSSNYILRQYAEDEIKWQEKLYKQSA